MKPIHRKIKQLHINLINKLLSQAVNYRGHHPKSRFFYNKEDVLEIRYSNPFDFGLSVYRAVRECKTKRNSFKHKLFLSYKDKHCYKIDQYNYNDLWGNRYDFKEHCFNLVVQTKESKKICGTDENWNNGTLGTDERYVAVAPSEMQELVISRNCNNCKWCINNVCENSDWKDGKPIKDESLPHCGYLGNKSRPIGWVYSAWKD